MKTKLTLSVEKDLSEAMKKKGYNISAWVELKMTEALMGILPCQISKK